jgi:hypothetical protein
MESLAVCCQNGKVTMTEFLEKSSAKIKIYFN